MIVTSSTYRQTSTVSAEQRQRDPTNRWLARGGRIRMSAAMIRDQALHAAGLLDRTLGGPSVLPYQPEGLWKEIATDTEYETSSGGDLYRRSLYTYWKRTVAPPNMMVFDAPSRESCTVRQTRTTTPLQALALMNDIAFVESARVLAERVIGEAVETDDRLRLAFRLATSRQPTAQELAVLESGLQHYVQAYQLNDEAAIDLARAGEAPGDGQSDTIEVAAFAAICSLILNLNETITKE